MTIISNVLIILAILLSILTFISLLGWVLKGGGNILFPGLGLVVALPSIIVLLLILQIVFVVLAELTKPSQVNSQKNQNHEYYDSREF